MGPVTEDASTVTEDKDIWCAQQKNLTRWSTVFLTHGARDVDSTSRQVLIANVMDPADSVVSESSMINAILQYQIQGSTRLGQLNGILTRH